MLHLDTRKLGCIERPCHRVKYRIFPFSLKNHPDHAEANRPLRGLASPITPGLEDHRILNAGDDPDWPAAGLAGLDVT